MNFRLIGLGAVVLSTGAMVACHDNHHDAPPPAPAPTGAYSTAGILTLAQQTSETSAPIAVNGGALTITDTSETSAPIAVSAM